jgi:imidazolonepropionase-like amidohydrolase
MSRIAACLCAVLIACGVSAADAPQVIVIHARAVLAEPGSAPLGEHTIVVTGEKITALEAGRQPAARYSQSARLIDLEDGFVLPGMIDLHKHVAMPLDAPAGTTTSEARLALAAAAVARAVLHAGVTTVRDVGDNTGVVFALRDSIGAGLIEGPRIIAAGRIVSRTGGHGALHGPPGDIAFTPGGCDGVESCRRIVRENIEAGSEWIKVTVSGSGGEPTGQADAEPIMFPEEVRAVMDAARQARRPVAAHAHSIGAIRLALESGARTIEHGAYFNDANARLFKAREAFLVPTAYVAEFVGTQLARFSGSPGRLPPEDLKRWTEAALAAPGRAWRAGVRLGVGSDSGATNDAHATAREVELFIASGVPAREALRAATLTNAEILGLEQTIGRIRVGYAADLIAVKGDPLQDAATLRAPTLVMKSGRVVVLREDRDISRKDARTQSKE